MNQVFTWPVGRAAVRERTSSPAPLAPVVVYLAASMTGGAVTGVLLALAGHALSITAGLDGDDLLFISMPVVLIAVLFQLRGRVDPLPQRRKQVPKSWLNLPRPELTAAGFGFMIGSGWMTYLRHASAWVLGLLVIAGASVVTGLVIGTAYGAARALPLFLTWVADRTGRRRIDWARLGRPQSGLALALAPTALLAWSIAFAVS